MEEFKLADADAFRSLGADRRMALWEVSVLADRPIGLFDGQLSETELEVQVNLPAMTRGEHVVQDYISTGLSLKDHPIGLVRTVAPVASTEGAFDKGRNFH
jgi:error-prone DNA polymerase